MEYHVAIFKKMVISKNMLAGNNVYRTILGMSFIPSSDSEPCCGPGTSTSEGHKVTAADHEHSTPAFSWKPL